MYNRLLLLLIFHLYLYVAGNGQSGNYQLVSHFNSENGLPQNSVTGIAADKNTFIWIGTQMGLARFDGHHLRSYNLADVTPDAENRVTFISNYNNRLMIGDPGLREGKCLETTNSSNLRLVENQSIIVTGRTRSVVELSAQQKAFFAELPGTFDDRYGYFLTSRGQIMGVYYFIHDSLFYYSAAGGGEIFLQKIQANRITGFVFHSCFYLVNEKGELTGWEKERRMHKVQGSLAGLLEGFSSGNKKEYFIRQEDTSVFLITGGKLYILKMQQPGYVDAELLTDEAKSIIGSNSILYKPDLNLLLMASPNDGIYIFRKTPFKILRDSSAANSTSDNIFYALQQNASSIFFGVGIIDSNGTVRKTNVLHHRIIPKTTDGYLIAYSESDKALHVYDSSLKQVSVFDDLDDGLTTYLADKDTLYLAGRFHLYKYLSVKGKCTRLGKLALPYKKECMYLAKGVGDSLWLASKGGLYVLNFSTQVYRTVFELDKTVVRSLYFDYNGTMWIGTYGKGWYRYRQSDGLLKIPIDRLGYLSTVHAFLEDDIGFMWMSTNNGLFRFSKKDLDAIQQSNDPVFYNYFNKDYGFLSNEFNGGCTPSALKMKDGRMAFPGMNGIVLFQPAVVPIEQPGNTLLFSDIQADGKSLDSVNIRLSPSFNSFSFRVAMPFYGQHYNLQVTYRLSNGDSSWTLLNNDGLIVLNRLGYGKYSLTVRVMAGFGSREYLYRQLHFTVSRFWYQTYLFYGLLTSCLAFIIRQLVSARLKTIRRRNLHLEKEVAARTTELRKSEERIKKSSQFKSKITSLVLHDIRSPLYYLNKLSGNIYKTSEGIAPEALRDELKDLHLSVTDISAYTQNLLAWINSQQDDFKLNDNAVNIKKTFIEIINNYHLLAEQNGNQITYDAKEDMEIFTQLDLLSIILRNIVDNAIKYTRNGRIILSAKITGNHILIEVTDTGKGMTDDKIQQIINDKRSYTIDTNSGMGYLFIKELLKKMHGRLELKSENEKGTTVTIILPVKTS